ncbi:MAG: site-specific DNA-methyltransferase [Chloroflexi bacterium]|nr:MAG: site-specific DNA-methyltransferase [Chloroflexota bacterium]
MTLAARSPSRAERQLPLFDIKEDDTGKKTAEPANKTRAPYTNGSAFSDPAFAINKTLPVHRWVPWIAGFSSDFVEQALSNYLTTKGTVLDPFAGVGTTLVGATLAGHNAIGFEINPYPALACRVKLSSHLINVNRLRDEIQSFEDFYQDRVASNLTPQSSPPQGFKTRAAFYSPTVLYKVLLVQDFVATIGDDLLRDLFKLVFAATMVSYSNYSYEPSLSRRVSSGKAEISDFPVMEAIRDKLIEVTEDIIWLQSYLPQEQLSSSVINDSFFNYQQHIEPQSIDLVVTSPPYLNNYHYNRNTRPQLYWLGYMEKPQDMRVLENANFGKYWQTVRDEETMDLGFSLSSSDIMERLQLLRSLNPHKKIYGGHGWANYAATYFNDCYKFAMGLCYCLKPGGTALIVLGNSILQGLLIPTDQYFAQIAESVGLELVTIHIPRTTRVGSSIIQSSVRVGKAEDTHQLYEAVVELRKR